MYASFDRLLANFFIYVHKLYEIRAKQTQSKGAEKKKAQKYVRLHSSMESWNANKFQQAWTYFIYLYLIFERYFEIHL